jgi:transcriptional regulator with XRE-family HTH domain
MLNRYYFKEWRIAAGFSLRSLARKIGHSYPTVQRIETGERDFFGTYLADFANGIGCTSIADPLTRLPDIFTINGNKRLSLAAQTAMGKRARELAQSIAENVPADEADKADEAEG